jgi:hypothetical protein
MEDKTQTANLTLTPAKIATFGPCKQLFGCRCKKKTVFGVATHRIRLIAFHAVINAVLNVYRETGGYPANLRGLVQEMLPVAPNSDIAVRTGDVEEILDCVKSVLTNLEPNAELVAIEHWLD